MSKTNNVYEIVVRSPDRIKFVEGVCEWAAKGAVFTGETPRLNRIPYSARFKYYTPKRIDVGRFGNYVVLEDWIARDKKELEGMPIWQIQKMAAKYSLTGRDKAQLIRAYLQAQDAYAEENGLVESVAKAAPKQEAKVAPKQAAKPKPAAKDEVKETPKEETKQEAAKAEKILEASKDEVFTSTEPIKEEE